MIDHSYLLVMGPVEHAVLGEIVIRMSLRKYQAEAKIITEEDVP
jgi:hypothetical protein